VQTIEVLECQRREPLGDDRARAVDDVARAAHAIPAWAFAATVAQWIIQSYGQSWLIGVYLLALCVISYIAVSAIRDPMGVDLNVREVHDDYLHEHPEIAGLDLGVAGESGA